MFQQIHVGIGRVLRVQVSFRFRRSKIMVGLLNSRMGRLSRW